MTDRDGASADGGTGPAAEPPFDPRGDRLQLPRHQPTRTAAVDPRELRELIPAIEQARALDDWGRWERVIGTIQPLLDFYYRYWFRVEQEGVEHVPARGGALLVSNHSGALPPDAPMISQAILHEHPSPRPLHVLAEHWFKGYPGVGL